MQYDYVKEDGKTVTQNTNGSDADYRHHVEQTFARYDKAVKECDQLRKELAETKDVLARADVQIGVFREEIASMRKERSHYQLERDQAVAERAKYESMFAGLHAQLHAFQVPAPLLIKNNIE